MTGVEEDLRAFYDGEMEDRAVRPLGDQRTTRVTAFAEQLRAERVASVLEVGCGAGRDGVVLRDIAPGYAGVDLSAAAVRTCRRAGLPALEASATRLPFADNSFDAAWSMSTLMHLSGGGLDVALRELARVVVPRAPVAIGVWGSTRSGEWIKEDGRYFRHRSDAELQQALGVLGEVVGFETWDWFDDGGHYQFARLVTQ